MLKKTAFILAAAIICLSLSACLRNTLEIAGRLKSGETKQTTAEQNTSSETAPNTEQTTLTTAAETEPSQQTETAKEEKMSLFDLTPAEKRDNSLTVYDNSNSRELFVGTLADLDIIGAFAARIDGKMFPQYNTVRCSNSTLVPEDKENYYGPFFNSRIDVDCFRPISDGFVTSCAVTYNDPIMVLEPYAYHYLIPEKLFDCAEILYGYSAEVTGLNCFIRYTDQFNYEIIPDPAYMEGLPVYSRSAAPCAYDINGTRFLADTVKAYADSSDSAPIELRKAANQPNGKYVYGKINGTIACYFGSKSGYITPYAYNSAQENYYSFSTSVTDFTLISEDTDAILRQGAAPLTDGQGIYGVLTDNRDMYMNNCVCGLRLIDLNGDDFPELFVSRLEPTDNSKTYVDIYDINGGMNLLGTLETNSGYANNICYVFSPDGNGWLFQSRRDIEKDVEATDNIVYLMNLRDGKLEFKRYFAIEYKPDENRMTVTNPIFLGKPLEYETGVHDGSIVFFYGGISSPNLRALMSKLYGNFLEDNVWAYYPLNSTWLSNVTSMNETPGHSSNSIVVIPQDDRTIAAQLAFATEKWYECGNNYIEGLYPPNDIFK